MKCDICDKCLGQSTQSNLCDDCIHVLPFNHYKSDDEFKFQLLSFFKLNRDIEYNKFISMKLNPFEMNDLVLDKWFYDLENETCIERVKSNYIFPDEFNNMLTGNSDDLFSLLHVNARSLIRNFDNFSYFLGSIQHNFSVIGISETWFQPNTNTDMFSIPGYTLVNVNRCNKIGGGVCIYVNNDFDFEIYQDVSFCSDVCDSLFLELNCTKRKSVIIGCVYKPPNVNLTSFNEKMQEYLNLIDRNNLEIFIMGDFNANLLNVETNQSTNAFLNLMYSHSFYPLITKPTRISTTSATLIDNIFCNSHDISMIKSCLVIDDMSDHFPICAVKKITHVNKCPNISVKQRLITDDNIKSFKRKLKNIEWSILGKINDVNACYEIFLKKFKYLYNESFPEVVKKKYKHMFKKPWVTKSLLRSINKKNRLHKNYLKNRCIENKLKLTKYRNKLTQLLRIAKKDYYLHIFNSIKGDIKKTWNQINNLLGKRKLTGMPNVMFNNGTKYETVADIVDEFNSYFASIGSNISQNIPSTTCSFSSFLNNKSPINSMFLTPTSVFEVLKICSTLNPSKSSGCDDISPRVVKSCINFFVEPLTYIFNQSLCHGIIPDKLKISKVIPIFKKGDRNEMTNYRPIAVIPIFAKLLEKLIHKRLYSFLQLHNILIKDQFGFRKQHSTELAVLNLFQHILENIERGKYCVGIFMDLSKAFDTIDHHILLQKLHYYGVRGNAFNWFNNYLTNRTQYVVINGVKSSIQSNNCGVPQGSVLGPLLFLIYINDIVNSSNLVRFSLFADDTCVTMANKSIAHLIKSINAELKKINCWFQCNKLSLNVSKTNYIIFKTRNRRVPENLDDIHIDDITINRLSDVKFLGIIFNENLNWNTHIYHLCNTISKNVGILSKLKYILPKNILLILYNTLILSYLNYGSYVWGNTYNTHLSKIELLQKKAVRIITMSDYRSPSASLFKKLKILPIYELVTFNTIIFIYSSLNNLIPKSNDNLFVFNSELHPYNTRQGNKLHIPFFKTTVGLQSVISTGLKKWNELPPDIKSSRTLNRFKAISKSMLLDSLSISKNF